MLKKINSRDYQKILAEYHDLTKKKFLEENDMQRLNEILELAITDRILAVMIHQIDLCFADSVINK